MSESSSFGIESDYRPRHSKKRRTAKVWVIVVASLALVSGVTAAAVAALLYFGIIGKQSNDYPGPGTGSVQVTIHDGDFGDIVSQTLVDAGVTKTFDCFFDLLLKTSPEPVFTPGVYMLKREMSAQGALDALLDPANRVEFTVTIPEGSTQQKTFSILSQELSIPLTDFESLAAHPGQFGLPAEASNLEGFLYPATYTFDPGVTAQTVLTRLVDETLAVLDQTGVPIQDRWNTIILASIIQKEASSLAGDAAKVSRVFHNRLDQGMLLGSDVTTCYGAGLEGKACVEITQAALDDPNNLYNTRLLPGLPIGPISNPAIVAIEAAWNPAEGPWLYFCTVNLTTGETVFSETLAEHEVAVEQLNQWLADNPDAY